MASSRFCDTWRAVRQKMSFHPFHGMWTGEVAPRPRPGSRARNNCCVRGSPRRDGVPEGRSGRGIALLLKAPSAKALATIRSEPMKAGRFSAYPDLCKPSSRSGGYARGDRHRAHLHLIETTLGPLQGSTMMLDCRVSLHGPARIDGKSIQLEFLSN